MNQPKRKLKINMIELESAFELYDELSESSSFLDLETGKVVVSTRCDSSSGHLPVLTSRRTAAYLAVYPLRIKKGVKYEP